MGACWSSLAGPREATYQTVYGKPELTMGKLRAGEQWVTLPAPHKAWGLIPLGTVLIIQSHDQVGLGRVTAQIVQDVSDSGLSSISDHLQGTDRPGPSAFRDATAIARREPDRRCCMVRLRVAICDKPSS